jgi:hypothetical protein
MESSSEVTKLQSLIRYKRRRLDKLKDHPTAFKYAKDEIDFLSGTILPIVEKNTVKTFGNITEFCHKAYATAAKFQCNAVMFFIPIANDYTGKPTIGIVNPNDSFEFGKAGASVIYPEKIQVINMDGNEVSYKPKFFSVDETLISCVYGGDNSTLRET